MQRKNLPRRLKWPAAGSFFIFAALLAAALFLEFWQRNDDNAALFAGAVPTALIVLDTVPAQSETELCYYRYQPLTPFPEPGNRFLHDDTEDVKIAAAEKIDAEYLAQALFTDEEETDISYRIAGMVENGVSTGVSTSDGIWDVLCHVEKNDLADRKSYELYEEELPESEVRDEFSDSRDGYFVYNRHKDIKNVHVTLSRKPYYFGPEPVIAVVIDDMGINQRRTADISRLNAPLTSSFLTYGTGLNRQVKKAVQAGHEIMIHVPMEPKTKANLAPDTLTTEMDEAEIKNGLQTMLQKFKNVRGINNHMGSQFTEDKRRMNYVMDVLRDNNLFFLDSKTSAQSVGRSVAREKRVAYAHRHVFLDNENRVDYVNKQLRLAENIARRNGYVVAIGHPKSATYQALKEWLPRLPEKKIKLVHMSEIVKVLNPQLKASFEENPAE